MKQKPLIGPLLLPSGIASFAGTIGMRIYTAALYVTIGRVRSGF